MEAAPAPLISSGATDTHRATLARGGADGNGRPILIDPVDPLLSRQSGRWRGHSTSSSGTAGRRAWSIVRGDHAVLTGEGVHGEPARPGRDLVAAHPLRGVDDRRAAPPRPYALPRD